ncbi:MAG TPA: hypothetical protein VIS99_12490 [Terrimicrobiaceae bacterium]
MNRFLDPEVLNHSTFCDVAAKLLKLRKFPPFDTFLSVDFHASSRH